MTIAIHRARETSRSSPTINKMAKAVEIEFRDARQITAQHRVHRSAAQRSAALHSNNRSQPTAGCILQQGCCRTQRVHECERLQSRRYDHRHNLRACACSPFGAAREQRKASACALSKCASQSLRKSLGARVRTLALPACAPSRVSPQLHCAHTCMFLCTATHAQTDWSCNHSIYIDICI